MDGGPKSPRDPHLHIRGLKIPKHPQITVGRVRKLLREGIYERKESEAALRVVKPDDVVLELGGGIGYMSTLIASKKPGAKVHTYEANPALIGFIRSVHAANDVTGVTVHNKLLAAQDGPPVEFFVRKSFLASSMDRASDPDTIVSVEQVPVDNINTVLDALKPSILVCDIEGAEAHLLPAADFSCLRAAIIELHPQWIGQKGVQAVFDTMQAAGLTFYPKASEGKVVTFRKGW